MKHLASLAAVCLLAVPHAIGQPPLKRIVTDLKEPLGVAVGPGGKVYITDLGEIGKPNEGKVMVVENGKPVVFAGGLNAPTAIVGFQNWLFVAEQRGILRIDAKGKVDAFAAVAAFPFPPRSLHEMTVDIESGT